MDWPLVLAVAINSVFVLVAVQGLKNYVMPFLRSKYAWVLPLLATVGGPLMSYLTNFLTDLIGYPIDLSGITAVFTGTIAVVAYGVFKQTGRTKQGKLSMRRME